MARDWKIRVPVDLPTETVFEMLAELKAGTFDPHLDPTIAGQPEAEEWHQEITNQMLMAYEVEAARRRS